MNPDNKRKKYNRGKNKRFSDGEGKRTKKPYKRTKDWQE